MMLLCQTLQGGWAWGSMLIRGLNGKTVENGSGKMGDLFSLPTSCSFPPAFPPQLCVQIKNGITELEWAQWVAWLVFGELFPL